MDQQERDVDGIDDVVGVIVVDGRSPVRRSCAGLAIVRSMLLECGFSG